MMGKGRRWRQVTISFIWIIVFTAAAPQPGFALNDATYVSAKKSKGSFPLAVAGKVAPLYISFQDFAGVQRVAKHLQTDIARVTKTEPQLLTDTPTGKAIVLIGTLGKSPLIDQLVKAKKLDVTDIAGKWETHLIQVIEKPMPGVAQALVIVGSDKRGTIYGLYDLSGQIGVSPWHYWADVPVKESKKLYVLPGRHTQGEPAVKYRGIFINDEAPALVGWSKEKFGGFNAQFYDKVFELILRLKGNYLWPAMWGNAFSDDDKMNPVLADEYGIVIGTSHHEPLMRAHDEWRRYGNNGKWNYQTNEANLKNFWREGIKRMGTKESIVSIGMRGDGDEPMSEESNIALLERIVKDQRQIIADVTGKPASATPQLWALYKEVQDYYEKGMRVPDDVTLLLADDNWGNIRMLPKVDEKPRTGGYGIYYHFDYVGGPRNYKWINTNPLPRIWEQMHLAYRHKVDRIWIVNVGDIKPVEYPTEFFLDYAWAPDNWPAERLEEYSRLWAEQQFGPKHAVAIADILSKYSKYNSRRKPELLSPDTYNLVHYREAEIVVTDYNKLAQEAEKIYQALPAAYKDAYNQLVLYPVQASANINELYVTVGKNYMYAQQGRAATNDLAARARALFARDAELSGYYNKTMANGKWNHMMDQTHIGYTTWQQPDKDVMPEVKEITLAPEAQMGLAIEGSEAWWPQEEKPAALPEFTAYGPKTYYLDIFNRGQVPFTYTVQTGAPWLQIASPKSKEVEKEQRLFVSIDWQKAPSGIQTAPITINGAGSSQVVQVKINNPANTKPTGFVESNGYISIEAVHYAQSVANGPVQWKPIPDLGRTLSAMTLFPVTAPSQTLHANSPRLEYQFALLDTGAVNVHAYFSPTLNYNHSDGLRYAISIDDEKPQIMNLHPDLSNRAWEQSVANNIRVVVSRHQSLTPGNHTLKFWMVDPGVVLQKLVIDTGGLQPSYLGPPESINPKTNKDR
ncbi:MAG: glycosyl hydrolase [Cytophagales bacterium CG18_big_fil_WC_8_21_14_2_50_42_9]|nr:MAG: glycosyl hydrolase [Cytophagales bacterium CG18_big_fil_WC_8_21_14_2_50_42_9]